MTPKETMAARTAFEADAKKYSQDLSHDVKKPGNYACMFAQGRWVSWQAAWEASKQYANGSAGKRAAEEAEPAPAPVMHPNRITRTARVV